MGDAMNGYKGCGVGQYQVGSSSQCDPRYTYLLCSTCAACPAGQVKAAGCSKLGVEACCTAGTYYVAPLQFAVAAT